jgi:hypothetical protein
MSDDPQSEKERNKSAVVRISTWATVSSSAEVHVRLIQQSPNADPKLVAMAREFAEEVKKKEGEPEYSVELDSEPLPDAPLIVTVENMQK